MSEIFSRHLPLNTSSMSWPRMSRFLWYREEMTMIMMTTTLLLLAQLLLMTTCCCCCYYYYYLTQILNVHDESIWVQRKHCLQSPRDPCQRCPSTASVISPAFTRHHTKTHNITSNQVGVYVNLYSSLTVNNLKHTQSASSMRSKNVSSGISK